MTKDNVLKQKVKEILEINAPQDRIPLKTDLRKWLRQQPYEFLLPLVDDLNMKQLGIIMNLGLTGSPYKKAEEMMKEYKDNIVILATTPISEGNPLLEEKPSIDVKQGLDQFKQDIIEEVIHKSDDDTLLAFSDMIVAEMSKRHPTQSPDVA